MKGIKKLVDVTFFSVFDYSILLERSTLYLVGIGKIETVGT